LNNTVAVLFLAAFPVSCLENVGVAAKNIASSTESSPVAVSPSVNGSPVDNEGINGTSGLLRSKSSSTLLFWLASVSTKTIGISSPEFHSSSTGWISISPNPKPTRTVFGVSL
jgi:hypothetical protein